MVAVTLLLSIFQNNRASTTNMQFTHSSGIQICFGRALCIYVSDLFLSLSLSFFFDEKAKRFLDSSTIFHSDIDEAMQRITHTVQTLKHFCALFDKYKKEKLESYFIENQRSVAIPAISLENSINICICIYLIRFYSGHFIRTLFLNASMHF